MDLKNRFIKLTFLSRRGSASTMNVQIPQGQEPLRDKNPKSRFIKSSYVLNKRMQEE